jgi:DNA repair exonuclease SbcCD nuclease subunit
VRGAGLRILHTADWQIGKGFAFVDGDTGALLRERRIDMLADLAALAAAHEVDLVLVAGDVFDAPTLSDRTLLRTCEQLAAFTVPVVLLPGNHDAARSESIWTRLDALAALPPCCIPALEATPLDLLDGRVTVLPAPLRRRREPDDLTAWFDQAPREGNGFRIGLAHGTVRNRLPVEAEAHNPIADDRADRAKLDYLALGDWHGTLQIAPRTWYAGTPETDGFRANASGQVLLVELDAPGAEPRVRALPTTRFRFRTLELELDGALSIESLADRLEALPEPGDTLLRLVLGGQLDLAGHAALEGLLARWDARLRLLEVDAGALRTLADAAELDGFAGDGFVADAARRLLAETDSADASRAAAARDALQLLYTEHQALLGDDA